jgi:hypothetical protein
MRGEIKKTRYQKYKEFTGIWEDYPRNLVMRKLNIQDSTYEHFLGKAIAESRAKREQQEEKYQKDKVYSEKEPFSCNEEDYGTKISWPKKYQNSPIQEAEVTALQLEIRKYISTFKISTYGRDVEYADKEELDSEPALLDVGN